MYKNKISFTKLDTFVLIVIFLLGCLNLANYFTFDQSLFILAAKAINEGKIIYQDFWDWKQPNIFYFYFFAGKLFGFNEFGIHLFEIIYQIILAVILLVTLRPLFRSHLVSSLLPLLTVGFYYIVLTREHQTQVETLVGLPIFLSMHFAIIAIRYCPKRNLFLFLSGFFCYLVVSFKLIFLPIIVSFWAISFICITIDILKSKSYQSYGYCAFQLFKNILFLALGLFLPIIALAIYFYNLGILEIAYKTFFVYPVQVNADVLTSFSENNVVEKFLTGNRFFLTSFNLLIILSLPAIFRQVSRIGKLKKLFSYQYLQIYFICCISWILIGLLLIYIQFTSLWNYHYFLVLIPLGILATKGLDLILLKLKYIKLDWYRWQNILLCSLMICFVNLQSLIGILSKAVLLIKSQINPEISKQYLLSKDVLRQSEFLNDPRSMKGDIYVIGPSQIYYVFNRNQAISVNGSHPITLVPELRQRLFEQIQQARPVYIFIFNFHKSTVNRRMYNLTHWIDQNYEFLNESPEGTWYALKL